MQFNDTLRMAGIDPRQVNVILHSPQHPEFAKVLPSLVHTRRAALDMYQATHNAPAELALKKGRPHAAVFVKTGQGRQVFVGLYANHGWRDRPWGEILAEPEAHFLQQTFGVFRVDSQRDPGQLQAFFDLRLGPVLEDLIGRLVVRVALTQNYVRLAESLEGKAPVLAILETGVAETPPPDWRVMTVTAAFLKLIPSGWASRLSQWRGIYLIVDETTGARYVGAAYGKDTNLLGRWQAHVAGAVGVTAQLRHCNPVNFRFSILERVSLDMPDKDVIALEQTWMTRLHTRCHGLNT